MRGEGSYNDMPMLSRSPIGGKKSARVEARVSEDLKEAIRRRWIDIGFASESEYIEFLTTVDCFGEGHVRMLHERRLSLVRTLSDKAPTREQA
jgi:hypothetical protein